MPDGGTILPRRRSETEQEEEEEKIMFLFNKSFCFALDTTVNWKVTLEANMADKS